MLSRSPDAPTSAPAPDAAAVAAPAELPSDAPPAPEPVRWADADTMRRQMFAGPPSYEQQAPYLLGDDIDDLQARAGSGDVKAMRTLGRGLHDCLSVFEDPDALDAKQSLDMNLASNLRKPDDRVSRDQNAYEVYDRTMARHVDCMALGRERAASGLGWLERAARAGDPQAKTEFASRALDRNAYPTEAAMLSDLDEVIRRRDLADAWVREAIESGERGALAMIANGPETMVRDERQRSIHQLAWRMVLDRDFGGAHSDDVGPMSERQYYIDMRQAWASDDAAWAGFVEEARRIASRTSELPPDQRRPRRPPGG